ncbi:DUF441 domain-containing protein [Oceanivirga salmonicida]|uniref:DUF441 domain-containing protein n=1 Tax=Oceanivirga salmonicida TaxID=1769291 RepID=UPI00082C97D7|nr:DUF441 family protein [Oceanivirga salmonicida]
MESYIILAIIGLIGLVGKNKILVYSALTLIALKLIPYSNKYLPDIKVNGLKIGIFIITVSVLVPIATGSIGLNEVILTLKKKEGIIALIVGVIASIIATKGIHLQLIEPEIVLFVSLGVVAGVAFVGGTPVGAIVASGLTYIVLKIVEKVI